MSAGIKEVLFISRKQDVQIFKKLFGTGSQLGMRLKYTFQTKPKGIPDAINVANKFIANQPLCLSLGGQSFYWREFSKNVKASTIDKVRCSGLSCKNQVSFKICCN